MQAMLCGETVYVLMWSAFLRPSESTELASSVLEFAMTWFGGANENLQYPHGSAVLSSNRGKPLGSASVAKESAPTNF